MTDQSFFTREKVSHQVITHYSSLIIPMSPSLVFSALLSTACGLIFHVIRGGNLLRLFVLLIAAWLGFAIGQLIGSLTDWPLLRVGEVYVLHGLIGSIIAMILTGWPARESMPDRSSPTRKR
jgi:uncharacterized membrane protein SpoIIM required for sporulation